MRRSLCELRRRCACAACRTTGAEELYVCKTEIVYDAEARSQIANGLNILANTVKLTLGPRGRNVVIDKGFGAPIVTKDGVTVAKEIELEDSFENMGAMMVQRSRVADR